MLNNSCANNDIGVAHYKQHQHMTRNKNITKHQRMKAILVNDLIQLMEFPVAAAGVESESGRGDWFPQDACGPT
jgi:hypothetical protein